MKLKVWLPNKRTAIFIKIDHTKNFCLIHKKLNEIYGLTGWIGYDHA